MGTDASGQREDRALQGETVQFTRGERNIFFHLLTACNLSCRHCYVNPAVHGKKRVDRRTLLQWLKLFHRPGKKNNLVFLGGEPTLHKDLAAGIRFAREIGYHSITVDTNGYLFNHLLDRIAPEDAVINFSLDGPTPEVNDPLRGEGVFEVCTRNIRKAVEGGFRVSVIYTASTVNVEALPRMPALLAPLGVTRFFIQVIGIRGRSAAVKTRLHLGPETWLKIVPEAAEAAADLGLEAFFPKVYLEPGEAFACAGNVADNYFVFPNGRVYRCPLCEDFPINACAVEKNRLVQTPGLTERQFFSLQIPEGCVMNKLIQPENLCYDDTGHPVYRIACCLLKTHVRPRGRE